jgi:hypothetical protein
MEGVGSWSLLRDMTFGFTVVELRCEDCGDVTERQLSGDAKP